MLNPSVKAISLVLGLVLMSACTLPATTIPAADGATLAGDSPAVANSYADIPISANDQLSVGQSLLLNTGEQWIGRAVLKSKLDTVQAFAFKRFNSKFFNYTHIIYFFRLTLFFQYHS